MNYYIRHYDDEVLKISLERRELEGIVCKILHVAEDKKHLLPIGMDVTDDGVLSWLRSRTIPSNRAYVDKLLCQYDLSHEDIIGVINICYGLSVNDCYWITPEDFNGSFSDFNLYDNDFIKALSLVAYTGYGSVKAKGFTSSPEFTTNGMLRKAWRRNKNGIFLYKGGTEGASNAGNEPYSEYYASQIAEAMGIKHIEYTLASWKKSVCSVCRLFTTADISFVPIWRFGEFKNIVQVGKFIKSLGESYYTEYVDMLIFDTLIYNVDRHQGNFGLLVDNKTNKPVAFAPIFDNGLGLFPYVTEPEIYDLKKYASSRLSAFDVSFDSIAKEYITDRQKKQLQKIRSFTFTRDKNYNLPQKRLKLIQDFIRSRAAELIDIDKNK